MQAQPSRRGFLSGNLADSDPIRPVGAIGEIRFHDICTGCGDCARACPERIIRKDRHGFPVLDFSHASCSFCDACVEACSAGALDAAVAWTWRAGISGACLSRGGVQCRTCQDHCDASAIRFRLQPGGRAEPRIDHDTCTGCGGCIASCPVQAITLSQTKIRMEVGTC